MAETPVLPAKIRQRIGRRAARRVRAGGELPAVIYGHKEDTVAVTVSEGDVRLLLRGGAHGLLELDIEGKRESAVIKEMQWDVFGQDILHVDFTRVSKDEKVTLEVPVVTRGTAPGVTAGGAIEQVLHSIELECPATAIQQQITVNINTLEIGQAILVKDLELTEGVVTSADPEQTVIQINEPSEEEESEEGIGATGAEPELIGREGKEEEDANNT